MAVEGSWLGSNALQNSINHIDECPSNASVMFRSTSMFQSSESNLTIAKPTYGVSPFSCGNSWLSLSHMMALWGIRWRNASLCSENDHLFLGPGLLKSDGYCEGAGQMWLRIVQQWMKSRTLSKSYLNRPQNNPKEDSSVVLHLERKGSKVRSFSGTQSCNVSTQYCTTETKAKIRCQMLRTWVATKSENSHFINKTK